MKKEDDLTIKRVILNIKPVCKGCKSKKSCEFFKEMRSYLGQLKKHFKTAPEKPPVELSFDSKEVMIPSCYGAEGSDDIAEFWIALELANGYTFKYINVGDYYIPTKMPKDTKCIYA